MSVPENTIYRTLSLEIEDLGLKNHKMVFLSGPRQCGKTTLAKSLLPANFSESYFNWDDIGFKKKWTRDPVGLGQELLKSDKKRIVFDELHKNIKWKNQLKGFYDYHNQHLQIIITGSAKLNTYRKGADSLLGRFIHFHVMPLTLGELVYSKAREYKDLVNLISDPARIVFKLSSKQADIISERLFKFSGFPEPYKRSNERFHRIWQKNRLEQLIRHDLKEISAVLMIGQVEVLASFLPEKVGSILSIKSLQEDLDCSYNSVRAWLLELEKVYYHFDIKPYSKSIPRSIKKETKIYLYDWTQVENLGARYENMVALHLLKMVLFFNDTGQANLKLCYLKNKEKEEVDFIILSNGKPFFTVEAKINDLVLAENFKSFRRYLDVPHFQVVQKKDYFKEIKIKGESSAYVISFSKFFSGLG